MSERYTLDELVRRVADDVRRLDVRQANGQVSAIPDGRTLRYYASLGLLDGPVETRGRRVYYGPRHVLQAVAIKALQAEGLALQEIQQRLTGRSDEELRGLVARPSAPRFWREPPGAPPPPAPLVPVAPRPDVPPARPAPMARRELLVDDTAPEGTGRGGGVPGPHDLTVAGAPPMTGGRPGPDPAAVRLAPGVTLVVEALRPLDDDDRRAVRAAASPLTAVLAERGLLRPEQEGA